MKKIKVTGSIKEFEKFINRHDVEIISVDVKGCEQSYMFQECFIGVIYYEDAQQNI